jgi:hypothetical protein
MHQIKTSNFAILHALKGNVLAVREMYLIHNISLGSAPHDLTHDVLKRQLVASTVGFIQQLVPPLLHTHRVHPQKHD